MRRVFVDYVQEGKCQIRFLPFPGYLHTRTGEPLNLVLVVEAGPGESRCRYGLSNIFVVVFVQGSGIHDYL